MLSIEKRKNKEKTQKKRIKTTNKTTNPLIELFVHISYSKGEDDGNIGRFPSKNT